MWKYRSLGASKTPGLALRSPIHFLQAWGEPWKSSEPQSSHSQTTDLHSAHCCECRHAFQTHLLIPASQQPCGMTRDIYRCCTGLLLILASCGPRPNYFITQPHASLPPASGWSPLLEQDVSCMRCWGGHIKSYLPSSESTGSPVHINSSVLEITTC